MPFHGLLNPSWLLADFDLEVTDLTKHLDRDSYVTVALRRESSKRRSSSRHADDRVAALIDRELGILLRYEIKDSTNRNEIVEFTEFHVGAASAADPELFNPPPDVAFTDWGSRKSGDGTTTHAVPDKASRSLKDDDIGLLLRQL
jgi:outer membrane lipoprotein-sorting protein